MRKVNHSANVYWSIGIGVIIAMVLSVLSAAMVAVFIDNETIGIEAIPYVTFVVWVISAFLCAYISGRKGEGKWILHSAVAAVIYYSVLLSAGIVIFDGVNGNALNGLLGSLLGFIGASFLVAKGKKSSAGRKMKKFKIK